MSWEYDEDLMKCNFCKTTTCCITCAKEQGWKKALIPKVPRQKNPERLGYMCNKCIIKLKPKETWEIL